VDLARVIGVCHDVFPIASKGFELVNASQSIVNLERVRGTRLVFPEWEDVRIIEAASILKSDYGLEPCLANPAEAGEDLRDELLEAYVSGPRNSKAEIARRLLQKPLFHAAMLVKTGHADAMIAGAANPTKRVIEAGLMAIGLAPGIETPSSFFLIETPKRDDTPGRALLFADCAINIDPTAEELADIAIASAASATKLLSEEPRIAFLSFSTHGSASHKSIDKLRAACEIARSRAPELAVDGELQADAALVPRVAAKKVRGDSDVAGRANVLIFPSLEAANIGYKLTQHLGGARAIGPILQGFQMPITDLSRGATVEDIVEAALITASLR